MTCQRVLCKAAVVGILCAVVIGPALAEEAPGDWETTLALGFGLTSGNSETMTANGSLIGEKSVDKHDVRLGAEANYGETEIETTVDGETVTVDETTVENAKGFINYKRKFDANYLYTDGSILYDDIGGIDYRLTLGAGVGRFLVDSDARKLNVEIGGAWIKEELTDGTSDDYFAVRFAAAHEQQLSETAKHWQRVEYLPQADDWDNYLLNAEVGVEAALNGKMNLRVVAQNRYDNQPPAGRDENDLAVTAGLVWKL